MVSFGALGVNSIGANGVVELVVLAEVERTANGLRQRGLVAVG